MATTVVPPTPRESLPARCSTCGTPADPQKRIAELEAQLRVLADKAASDKLALHVHERPTSANQNRISAFLSAVRRAAPPSPPPDTTHHHHNHNGDKNTPPITAADQAEMVARERAARVAAENRLAEVTAELEDLSATLFQTANEMVAKERRERARLEERVAMLEKREKEKGERLGMLERAVDRIGRVRSVLLETTAVGPRASVGAGSVR